MKQRTLQKLEPRTSTSIEQVYHVDIYPSNEFSNFSLNVTVILFYFNTDMLQSRVLNSTAFRSGMDSVNLLTWDPTVRRTMHFAMQAYLPCC